ncbi:hypothetical protein [Thalassobacillus sp. C254]|uniref:hypothetical protein n=1 Tax=Thalassobacillus sp. C254 TaxID=1225341 RepID=UPI0012ECE781|nr:hypothetical protein [Thalassobacillus sp. C254]
MKKQSLSEKRDPYYTDPSNHEKQRTDEQAGPGKGTWPDEPYRDLEYERANHPPATS